MYTYIIQCIQYTVTIRRIIQNQNVSRDEIRLFTFSTGLQQLCEHSIQPRPRPVQPHPHEWI
jgi:hypothetical protein